MTVILQNGPCDGERVIRLGEYTRSLRQHPAGQSARYQHSGTLDPASGWPIFVYAPPRQRKSR
jgi:hypothetical protein